MHRYINDYCEGIDSTEVAYGARVRNGENRLYWRSRCGKEISEFAAEKSSVDFGDQLCDQCYFVEALK